MKARWLPHHCYCRQAHLVTTIVWSFFATTTCFIATTTCFIATTTCFIATTTCFIATTTCFITITMNKLHKFLIALVTLTVLIVTIYLLSANDVPIILLPMKSFRHEGTLFGISEETRNKKTQDPVIKRGTQSEGNPEAKETLMTHLPPKSGTSQGMVTARQPSSSETITSKDINSVHLPLQPGDSHLPYEELNLKQIKQSPVDLFKETPETNDALNTNNNPQLKKILFWNDGYSNKHFGFGFGREPFLRAGCRVNTCFTTGDRSRFPLEEIDALVWHFRSNDKSLPTVRSPHTRYVFWMMESASYLYGNIGHFNNIFNWTFTYRLDSDFPNQYGRVYRRRQPLQEPEEERNYAANKTKLAAWFVSNCRTVGGREELVKLLRKWIKIDQYGQCGSLSCVRKNSSGCYSMLEKNYKFYFSFENSLCQDYATEKLFNILRLSVVPVVYGQGNYSMLAPPHSYIDALSFPTAKALAEYLIYLDKNDTAYNEYFRWKRFHWIPHTWANVAKPYCDMCERLHQDNTTKVYNLQQWFVQDSHCKSSYSKDISLFINGYIKR
ncbi:alpha-(1,3)-fucosyltransferase C-like [Homarus americanus]|uniref:alpha-(1,3)-fucosyltransferase C-like n=1 Tax=Homarus americanus TaxID=6706 RepID=UPI001C43C9EE|nr:alpha-(1,3)-fucosyltransferase C-like [Homarus americanus]XP_042232482.1 alpha-(1,3)-fucosyltransferase C-like [Homarus americanus]XP_042232483.1 alpha-(1,3)-fucosyltransferase C-like [Homarus americanus]